VQRSGRSELRQCTEATVRKLRRAKRELVKMKHEQGLAKRIPMELAPVLKNERRPNVDLPGFRRGVTAWRMV
jgi:hypothetical protein